MKSMILIITALVAFIGCKQAKYEFVGQKTQQAPEKNVTPEEPKEPTLGPNEYQGENGFTMKGNPDTVKVGEKVTFTGSCGDNADEELSWEFGDGKSGKGNTVTHVYEEARKMTIEASCTDRDGKVRKGTIIIYVNPGETGGDPNQNPNQGPNQSPNQNPSQKPNQSGL